MPKSRARRRRRQAKSRLFRVVVKGLPVNGLDLTWIRMQPSSAWPVAASLIFRSCIRKTPTRLHGDPRVARCLARVASRLPPPVASTFQRVCLQAFSGALGWCGLKSRQINYLQHIASETHYRGSIRQGKAPGKNACPPNFYTRSASSAALVGAPCSAAAHRHH